MVEDAAPPWSNPDGTGYANDVVRSAFHEVGVNAKFVVVPYARCKEQVMSGAVPACLSMTWLPEFDGKVILDSDPLIELNADVFESNSNPLPRMSHESCALPAETLVGIVNGYEYPKKVYSLFANGARAYTTRDDFQSLQMLSLNRIDAAVIITNDYQAKTEKAQKAQVDEKVHFAFSCGEQTGTIGFSTRHPDGEWAHQIFDKGLSQLKKKGLLKKFKIKWFGSAAAE
jgi:ABC-type amino acid transport substrate-binding protein